MKTNLKTLLFVANLLLCFMAINACKKEKTSVGTDKELLDMAKISVGFAWFKNSVALLNKSSGSGHAQPFLKTRYNALATNMLDSVGRIKSGAAFPEGSLIVKELYDNSTTIGLYAILYKKSSSADADAKGWVWGYVKPDGTVVASASNKGSGCIGCHSQTGNIDYMLMNKFFP